MEQDESGFSFSAARYWISDENHFPGPGDGGRGGCTASEISKAVTTFFVVYFAAIAAASVGILMGNFVNPPGGRGGGLGSRPKKMYGERLGDRVE